jgi:ribosome-binding protein aMBF1 (putative translation factor)
MKNKEQFQKLVTHETSAVHQHMQELANQKSWLDKAVSISIAIQERLEQLNWKQADLAKAMHVKPQYISRIIKARENLSLETIAKLEDVLCCSLIRFPIPEKVNE